MTNMQKGSSTALAEAVGNAAVATPKVGRTLQDEIRAMTPQLAAGIPTGTLTPERFVRTILTEVRKTPKLLECTRESVLGAMMQVAQLGLEVGSALGQAYLLPRWNGRTRVTECQLQVSYKGFIELAYRGGMIMEAREVYENDEFDFDYGSTPFIHHKWKLGKNRGEVIGYYGTVRLVDGRTKFNVMSLEDIEARRQRSPSKDSGPWITDPIAMGRKTAIRALVPQTPLSTEMSKLLADAISADDSTVLRDSSGNLKHVYQEPADPALEATTSDVANLDKKTELVEATNSIDPPAQKIACSRYLMERFGKPAAELNEAELDEALRIAYGWPDTKEQENPPAEAPKGAEAASGASQSAVAEVLAEVTERVREEALRDMQANFGESYDPNSQEALDWLEVWLEQPDDSQSIANIGHGGTAPSDAILASTQAMIGHWDSATCNRVLIEYGLSKEGSLDSRRVRLVAHLAPLREAGDPRIKDLF